MLRRATLLLTTSLPLLTLACGNVLVDPGASGGTGGTTSSGSTGSSSSGSGTTSSSSGSGGGTSACGQTHDAASFAIGTWDGELIACKTGKDGLVELDATVVDAGPTFLALDSCAPNADCLPKVSKLSVEAPGLSLAEIPKGAFVHVQLFAGTFMGGCQQRLLITNLPLWAGAPNPVEPSPRLWLMAADGDMSTFPNAPFHVEREPLGCYPDDPGTCDAHEDYVLRFRSALSPDDPGVLLAMGQATTWTLQSGEFSHQVLGRNLRSFASGWCDGPVEFAYWITHTWGLD
jgi:hypothetical protein